MSALEASQTECQKLTNELEKLKLDLKAVEEKVPKFLLGVFVCNWICLGMWVLHPKAQFSF